MLFISLLILIVAIALSSLNKNFSPILLTRIVSIVFIYAGALSLNAFYIQSIGSGVGFYSGLFYDIAVSEYLDTFISAIQPSLNNINLDIIDLNSSNQLSVNFFILIYKKINNNKLVTTLKKNKLIIALKKVSTISFLPPSINHLYKHIFVRIFRFIGGLCLILVISGYLTVVPDNFHFIIQIFALLQGIQIFIIFNIKLVYGLYLLIYKKEVFEVRNSPLD